MQRIQRWRATDPSNYAKGTDAVHSLIYKSECSPIRGPHAHAALWCK